MCCLLLGNLDRVVCFLFGAMAERKSKKTVSCLVSQINKRPNSTSKAERPKKVEFRQQVKSACGFTRQHTDDIFAKEEKYKLLNAELEAKTADIVRQADELMKKEEKDILSKPLSNVLLLDSEDQDYSSFSTRKPKPNAAQDTEVKVVTKKKVVPTAQRHVSGGKQRKMHHNNTVSSKTTCTDDFAALADEAESFMAKAVQSMEEKMSKPVVHDSVEEDVPAPEDNGGSGDSEAQTRVLKATLRIMQEELDQLSCEYYKRDDENVKLRAKLKEVEEDRARMQKTTKIQQTLIEKHRILAEESAKKSDGLQLQVSALQKEIENLNRSQKQAAAVHITVEVRLNRALEEVEKLRSELDKTKKINKDQISKELQSKENLLAENKMLKKQKLEIIVGFKKQLKLIDILERQKMHLEAAKLLSFTED
nr:testis-expressed protein 9 [Nothobranchius furzeri]